MAAILHLEPELIRDKDGSTWVHLGKSSRLDGAIVNDEVSHRVLSFAAPVLDGATRVEGRVSLVLADAYFPVLRCPGGADAYRRRLCSLMMCGSCRDRWPTSC